MNVEQKARELLAAELLASGHEVAASHIISAGKSCLDDVELAALRAIARALEQQPEAKRDREADRERFPDPNFNNWLDEVISDAGHTVWCAVGNLADAWAGWEARQYYGRAKAQGYPECSGNPASCPENEGFGCCGSEQPEGREVPVAGVWINGDGRPVLAGESDNLTPEIAARRGLRPLYTTPPAKVPEAVKPYAVGWLHEVVWDDETGYSFHKTEPKPLPPVPGLVSQRIFRAMLAAAQQPKEGAK